MTYYTSNCKNERRYLANEIIKRMDTERYTETSLSTLCFWYGRSPALIRDIIDNDLTMQGYQFEWEAWICDPDEIEDPEYYTPSQNVKIWVQLIKSPTSEV